MKKLIYSDEIQISKRKEFANQLITALNEVLTLFMERHNHFGQPISEDFAFALVADPVSVFDSLLLNNSPLKSIAGKQQNIEKLAELVNVDRNQFILDMAITLPGSVDGYNKQGRKGLMKLSDSNRHLVSWSKDKFILNTKALEAENEAYRVYATEPDQLAELEHYEKLSRALNAHLDKADRRYIDVSTIGMIANWLGLADPFTGKGEKRFSPDYRAIAKKIKMVLVN